MKNNHPVQEWLTVIPYLLVVINGTLPPDNPNTVSLESNVILSFHSEKDLEKNSDTAKKNPIEHNYKSDFLLIKVIIKMNLIKKSIWMYVVFIGGHLLISTEAQLQVNDTEEIKVDKKSEILSRRKRFIIFPEGSSLQLGKYIIINNTLLMLTGIKINV